VLVLGFATLFSDGQSAAFRSLLAEFQTSNFGDSLDLLHNSLSVGFLTSSAMRPTRDCLSLRGGLAQIQLPVKNMLREKLQEMTEVEDVTKHPALLV
jgi:hypothetical protein